MTVMVPAPGGRLGGVWCALLGLQEVLCGTTYGVAHPLLAPDEIASPVVGSMFSSCHTDHLGTQYPVPPAPAVLHIVLATLLYPIGTVPYDNLEIPPVRTSLLRP